MSVKVPPHRPTPGELDAARQMELPDSDEYVAAMFELAHRADNQGQFHEAINVLRTVALARPDDWRIYEALGGLYRNLGRDADSATCFAQARALQAGSR